MTINLFELCTNVINYQILNMVESLKFIDMNKEFELL